MTKDELDHPFDTWKKIRRMISRCLRRGLGIDEENLAGDIWLELWTKDRPLTWLHVKNRCIDQIRRKGVRKVFPVPVEELEVAVLEEGIKEVKNANRLVNELMKCPSLSPKDQEIIFLYFWREDSCKDMAVMIGLKKDEVKEKLNDVLKRLREFAQINQLG